MSTKTEHTKFYLTSPDAMRVLVAVSIGGWEPIYIAHTHPPIGSVKDIRSLLDRCWFIVDEYGTIYSWYEYAIIMDPPWTEPQKLDDESSIAHWRNRVDGTYWIDEEHVYELYRQLESD